MSKAVDTVEKMSKSLKFAKDLWKSAEMPKVTDSPEDPGKVALAIIAVKIFDCLD